MATCVALILCFQLTLPSARAQATASSASTAVSVSVEKVMPQEVLVGTSFEIVVRVRNLGDVDLQGVTLTDRTEGGARVEASTPQADSVDGATSTWSLGTIGARQTREVRIRAMATDETPITGCATVTFQPGVCATTKVVRPAIELVKTMPPAVLLCDPIPVKLVVRNVGSSALNNVRVTDTLPAGLTTDNGDSRHSFDVGRLLPGQSRELSFGAKAARTGTFVNPAQATSAEGAEASAQATVNVVQPVLTIACQTPALRSLPGIADGFAQFIGRPFEVCWEVSNTGNAPSDNSRLEVVLPPGVVASSATEGGTLGQGRVSWSLGSVAAGASKRVCATLVAAQAGSHALEASTVGACAAPATTRCEVPIQGVNAILVEMVDNPDPIQVGESTIYTVRITNQGGGLDLKDIAVRARFPEGIDPAAASDGGRISGRTVTWATVAALPLGQSITYTVTGAARAQGDHRIEVEVTTQDRATPITELESTTVY
jgi:uncharacterized repeat protein (TIGR01451 family)